MDHEETTKALKEGRTSLGIEFGSTRIKAILIDEAFQPIAQGTFEWESSLQEGIWTYNLIDIITGLQVAYREMKEQVEQRYGVTIQSIGSIGVSAMMHGYVACDHTGEVLVPFRTWRNATTIEASQKLTDVFQFHIPERWSIAHLYQAILEEEKHLSRLEYMTTLSGYIHWLLTGKQAIGIGDASGMFPIDEQTKDYNEVMLHQFEDLIVEKGYPWKLRHLLPRVYLAGEEAGVLTAAGAAILDQGKHLKPGIPFCPPEGDAGTGMVATNSVEKRTGNISVGTSVFAMIVLEQELKGVYPEVDMVTTPDGLPVAMVHANNCTSDLNAWMNIFREAFEALGMQVASEKVYEALLQQALEADRDGGGLLSYGYYSGENITRLPEGRPLFVRSAESRFNLANFMRTHLFSAFGAMKIGMDRLKEHEQVVIDRLLGHGGLFKTPLVGQKMVAAALDTPVSVVSTAGEGGAFGMAVLASYMVHHQKQTLAEFLTHQVFAHTSEELMEPDPLDVKGFDEFLKRYQEGLAIEEAAVAHLMPKKGVTTVC
ncbi:FGGY-family carbohydrate kinase [Bacillus pumilus]|uniref:xylulokinase n=1 Tax=Bacillus pumilus TaxID=1408 RepID=UPI001CE6D857|nr:FGGY-family carbohydrate kinase [Bacillus pumilus]MDF2001025.1 FGGY-family carbohydrate kinase [Bacillus pumilus]MDF2022280.1 FGGY-family carbohydrate kinase [Bacillus pumilus]MDF2025907.1 FGGY-family carbohydrate kinase [Bacillus pumilus]MDF2087090.1 FGGY-family carbohydrate kinase [Bacillus pumilus]QZD60443.1 ATPase [Bacillus pumilus]